MFSQNIGGPGIGLHPQNLDVPCIWRSTTSATLLQGEVVVLDIPAVLAEVTGAASPGGDDSPFANVKITPSNVNVPRYGIFGVALADAEDNEQVMIRFAGVLGTKKDGVASNVNPGDGAFVVRPTSGDVGAGSALVIDQGTMHMQPDAALTTGEENFKVIGRNLVLQEDAQTAQKSAVLFNGIFGFGAAGDN